MLSRVSRKIANRVMEAAGAVSFLAAALLIAPQAFAQKSDKNHRDAFMRGEPNEEQLAQKVRHELATDAAVFAAWSAPGVTSVENLIEVSYATTRVMPFS